MSNIKDLLEVAYYVAFIVLTYLIVKYARKTFLLQSEKSHSILCKLCVIGDQAHYQTKYGVELYNYGNDIAKDVTVKVQNSLSFKCDYIKPNESVVYPLGVIMHMIAGNRVLFDNITKEVQPGETIEAVVSVDGKQTTHTLCADLLFSIIPGSGLNEIANNIEKVASEIRDTHRR